MGSRNANTKSSFSPLDIEFLTKKNLQGIEVKVMDIVDEIIPTEEFPSLICIHNTFVFFA